MNNGLKLHFWEITIVKERYFTLTKYPSALSCAKLNPYLIHYYYTLI